MIDDKLARAEREMRRLGRLLEKDQRVDLEDDWLLTAGMAFGVHGIYTGMEDVLADLAREIDGRMPQGAQSHQQLLDQMRVALEGRRPALLDEKLYVQMVELKAFRHFVRHQYGIDLRSDKTRAKVAVVDAALAAFKVAVARLEAAIAT